LKAWRREWKIALIERDNPFWEDRAVMLGFPPLA
jgi:putative endonuclease